MSSVLEIHPLTRVEGHGTVRVLMDDGRVERVELSLCESPRLFEALLVGKRFDELPEIICRICSICSSVHRVTSLLAIEKALGVEVSEQTRLYRELIVNGGQIESHALHLFCLVLPDHFGARGFADLASLAPGELKMGLRIKGSGNLIQETVGGRLIHPANLIPGGLGKPVGREGLLKLREALKATLSDAARAVKLFSTSTSTCLSLPPPHYLAVAPGPFPPLFGDTLATGDGASFPVTAYREHLAESVVPHSNAKVVTLGDALPTVGALSRVNLGERLSASASRAYASCRATIEGGDICANTLAQAVELVSAVERSVEIVDLLLEGGFRREAPVGITPRRGSGTAVMEAPRGVLIHSYAFDGRGTCTTADIVTPTAINQGAMERDLFLLAKAMEGADAEELKHQLEVLVRAYDPCISCSVHIVSLQTED